MMILKGGGIKLNGGMVYILDDGFEANQQVVHKFRRGKRIELLDRFKAIQLYKFQKAAHEIVDNLNILSYVVQMFFVSGEIPKKRKRLFAAENEFQSQQAHDAAGGDVEKGFETQEGSSRQFRGEDQCHNAIPDGVDGESQNRDHQIEEKRNPLREQGGEYAGKDDDRFGVAELGEETQGIGMP